MGKPYRRRESASLLTREPEPEAISLATATFCISIGAKGRDGADQIDAATRPEQTALPITSFQGTLGSVVTAFVVSGRTLKASTTTDPLRATRKTLSNLPVIFMSNDCRSEFDCFDVSVRPTQWNQWR
eukprot:scaffold8374_cov175-Amphora_coffeaeformis.AAC.117